MEQYTTFSPRCSLAAVALLMRRLGIWAVVEEQVHIRQKTVIHSPLEKLLDGFVNVDLFNENADLCFDLNTFPYPFNDGDVSRILISHTLEHLDSPNLVLKELNRILKPGGLLIPSRLLQ